jgi:hypothetical protein
MYPSNPTPTLMMISKLESSYSKMTGYKAYTVTYANEDASIRIIKELAYSSNISHLPAQIELNDLMNFLNN